MEKASTKIDIVVETDLSPTEFNIKLLEWMQDNGWQCGGTMQLIEKETSKITIQIVKGD
jgi:hypothetical protein